LSFVARQAKLTGVSEFDIIVIGGGPAGATAAAFCAQKGLAVAVIEHKRFPRRKVCGDVLNPNVWPTLERLGVAGKIRDLSHHTITGALFTTSAGASLDIPLHARAIRRSLFDDVLLQHARDCGALVVEGEAALEISPMREVVTRSSRHVSRKGIIAADGRHSIAARRSTPAHDRIAFQAHFRAPVNLDDRVQLHLFPGGYGGLVRLDDGQVNICIVTDRAGAQLHDDCEALFARTVWRNRHFRALGISPEPLEPLQSAHPLVTQPNQPYRDGVWLAGDALRTTEPFTGQGIYFALRTGELAADSVLTGHDYGAAVRSLYRQRTRTNELLRRLMYRERIASPLVRALRHWPVATRWLAGNVLETVESRPNE
jgi:flavin-dependent dehydrogenase